MQLEISIFLYALNVYLVFLMAQFLVFRTRVYERKRRSTRSSSSSIMTYDQILSSIVYALEIGVQVLVQVATRHCTCVMYEQATTSRLVIGG